MDEEKAEISVRSRIKKKDKIQEDIVRGKSYGGKVFDIWRIDGVGLQVGLAQKTKLQHLTCLGKSIFAMVSFSCTRKIIE